MIVEIENDSPARVRRRVHDHGRARGRRLDGPTIEVDGRPALRRARRARALDRRAPSRSTSRRSARETGPFPTARDRRGRLAGRRSCTRSATATGCGSRSRRAATIPGRSTSRAPPSAPDAADGWHALLDHGMRVVLPDPQRAGGGRRWPGRRCCSTPIPDAGERPPRSRTGATTPRPRGRGAGCRSSGPARGPRDAGTVASTSTTPGRAARVASAAALVRDDATAIELAPELPADVGGQDLEVHDAPTRCRPAVVRGPLARRPRRAALGGHRPRARPRAARARRSTRPGRPPSPPATPSSPHPTARTPSPILASPRPAVGAKRRRNGRGGRVSRGGGWRCGCGAELELALELLLRPAEEVDDPTRWPVRRRARRRDRRSSRPTGCSTAHDEPARLAQHRGDHRALDPQRPAGRAGGLAPCTPPPRTRSSGTRTSSARGVAGRVLPVAAVGEQRVLDATWSAGSCGPSSGSSGPAGFGPAARLGPREVAGRPQQRERELAAVVDDLVLEQAVVQQREPDRRRRTRRRTGATRTSGAPSRAARPRR